MDRRVALVLLAVLATGVFLAGLELMITAVALPAIIADLGSWTELRHASWIINAYLLVYVGTMPLAGRLADTWGARRLFLGALVFFTLGSLLAGMAQTLDQLIAGPNGNTRKSALGGYNSADWNPPKNGAPENRCGFHKARLPCLSSANPNWRQWMK